MKRSMKLSKLVIRELKKQYGRIKQEADAVYEKWSELRGRVTALETVLAGAGFPVKKDGNGLRQTTDKIKGRVSQLRLEITEILKAEGKATKASVIRQKLEKRKVPFRTPYFWRVLGRLEGKGVIKRVGPGMYQLVNGVC